MSPQVNGALKKLSTISKQLAEQLAIVDKYTFDKLEVVMDQVDAKNQELKELDAKLVENERVKTLDIDLKLKEYGKTEAMKILADEINELNQTIAGAEKAKSTAVAIASSSIEKRMQTENTLANNNAEIVLATLKAESDQKSTQIIFLNEEIDRLTLELTKAGDRIVSVAQASTSSAISIAK